MRWPTQVVDTLSSPLPVDKATTVDGGPWSYSDYGIHQHGVYKKYIAIEIVMVSTLSATPVDEINHDIDDDMNHPRYSSDFLVT